MKGKELNEKESLELIARMIRNTRRNLDTGSGNSFLVWGYVGVLVTLTVWAGVTFTGNPIWMWGFWGIPVVGFLLMFLLLRKRQKTVKFYLDKILERVWGVFGMVCMMGVLAATDAGRYETILPLCAIFFSLGSIITGCIIRYTTFFIFPLFGFLWGLKQLLYTWGEAPSLSSLLWMREAWRGSSRLTFGNLNRRTAWLIPVVLFCLWWPMDMMRGAEPDFSPIHLFAGGSAMAFCPMTPVFLVLLLLSKENIDLTLLRVTALVGFIIGCYNMGNFAADAGFYLGLYHLPLVGISLYALLKSKWKNKILVCLKN